MLLRTLAAIACAGACLAQTPQQDRLAPLYTTIVVTAAPLEPSTEDRDGEAFRRPLFSRDDQLFHLLDAGINAGQHEGGGKSVEIRRFGFNLDHGGASGGLKVLVDNVPQNQPTQAHGQGYLGSLKSLTPELVEEVRMVNGPFRAEYGDFSGLGVVHIRLRDSLPDEWTARLQRGSFGASRAFLAFSPDGHGTDAFLAYEGSRLDGPFRNPLGYGRNHFTGHYAFHRSAQRRLGFRFNAGWNGFSSSGQIPLDEVAAGRLDRFGYVDPTDGGRVRMGTVGIYYRDERARGGVLKLDGFAERSLFDLFSNFTFFLHDPVAGDAFQQHDSRLQDGVNAQYLRPHRFLGAQALLTAGGNFHENWIQVGLYPRQGRVPAGVTARANVHLSNPAGYFQENLSLLDGRMQVGAGLRLDEFRFAVRDRLDATASGVNHAQPFQPKASFALTPWRRAALTLHAAYGRGISTADARAVVQHPGLPAVAATDFYQWGVSHRVRRLSVSGDLFHIDRSHELVYLADDGTFEFQGPSRAYGYEGRLALRMTRHLSLDAGLTRVTNAYYRGTRPRLYVTNAPHLVANAGLTLAPWKGWSGSLRLRGVNHYRLDSQDPSLLASGNLVADLALSRRIRRGVELNLAVDNLGNRDYWETQNYFVSRLAGQEPGARLHATPGYPRSITVGLTLRGRGK